MIEFEDVLKNIDEVYDIMYEKEINEELEKSIINKTNNLENDFDQKLECITNFKVPLKQLEKTMIIRTGLREQFKELIIECINSEYDLSDALEILVERYQFNLLMIGALSIDAYFIEIKSPNLIIKTFDSVIKGFENLHNNISKQRNDVYNDSLDNHNKYVELVDKYAELKDDYAKLSNKVKHSKK